MATVNKRKGSAGLPWDGMNRHFTLYEEIDLAATEGVTANIIQCLDVPAHVRVMKTMVEIIRTTVVATSMVADVGYTGVVNAFDAAIDLEAANKFVYQSTPSDVAPALGGALFTAAGTIDLVLTTVGAITTAPKFRIWAFCEYIPEHVT